MTTLVADVRGFASLVTWTSPERALGALHAVLEEIAAAVAREEGIVNGVLGSALLAVFGTSAADEDHAGRAARSALAIRARLAAYAPDPRSRHRAIHAGIGLGSGTVVAGPLGGRADPGYVVVGHAVTVASRLGAHADGGQILVGPGTAALLSVEFDVRDRGVVDLAGVGPTTVFELVR